MQTENHQQRELSWVRVTLEVDTSSHGPHARAYSCLTPRCCYVWHLHVRASGTNPQGEGSQSLTKFCTELTRPTFPTLVC